VTHLAEVQKLSLEQPLDVPFLVSQERVLLADAGGKLHLLNANSFEPISEIALPAAPVGRMSIVNDRLYVSTAPASLSAVGLGDPLQIAWTISVGGAPLAGQLLDVPGGLLATTQEGRVLVLNPDDGSVVKEAPLGLPSHLGPLAIDKHVIVPTIDGSVSIVDALFTP
jgi:hypothetical protein